MDAPLNEAQLLAYLRETQELPDVGKDSLLFSNGNLDSVSQLDLIMFIEKQAGFQVSPMDLTLDNFDSVSRILAYVESRVGA